MNTNYKKFINLSSPILITGETGTGKSRLARMLFNDAHINKEKFLTVHLASLKEDLLESELFGHKRGSFTGAVEGKNGYLKEVGRGTLFLDEIGELSLESQKKLLYLLEEKKFTPLGSTDSVDFNGRIIMATNKNLKQMVDQNLFREDLYYRVCVFEYKLPPIRLDKSALQASIEDIFEKCKKEHQRPHSYLSQLTLDFLLNKEWKGNFRELKNSIEYAVVMSGEAQIQTRDFPQVSCDQRSCLEFSIESSMDFIETFPEDFSASLEQFEKLYLSSVLVKNSGKVNETARRIGMSKTTLIQKAKKYNISTLKMRADASLVAA